MHCWHPVHVDDAISGIIAAVTTNGCSGVFIIAGDEAPEVGRLAKLIARELDVDLESRKISGWSGSYTCFSEMWAKFKAKFGSARYYRENWAYSIEKARCELGYAPQVSLEDGIRRTLAWAKKADMFHNG